MKDDEPQSLKALVNSNGTFIWSIVNVSSYMTGIQKRKIHWNQSERIHQEKKYISNLLRGGNGNCRRATQLYE